MKNATLLTYSTEDGGTLKKKKVEARFCWSEPDRTLEIVIDEQETKETVIHLPLNTIIKMIMQHITGKK